MGTVQEEQYMQFPKALWFEKLATVTLIIGILVIGLMPLWLSDMIGESIK